MPAPSIPELLARARRPLRIVAVVVAGWTVFAFAYVALGRLGYPYELEWMTGSILDHVERVQKGLPVYGPPTTDWIPFLYPPLYYWLSAACAMALPLIVACRTVSIASTIVQAACVWRLARRHGADAYWSALGVAAFVAAYQISDYWYDIERPDSLFVAMVMMGAVALDEVPGVPGAALSAATLGLAFFAKQPATIFLAGGGAALLLRREWARAATFAAVGGAVLVAGTVWLEAKTGGWFGYYVLRMPVAHGMSWSLVPTLLFEDLPHAWAWAIATAALVGSFVAARARPREDTVFVCFLGAGFLAAATSRLHIGGWANVLMFWTSFGSAAIAVYASRLEASLRARNDAVEHARADLLPLALAAALATCAYAPGTQIPTRAAERRHAQFLDTIRDLETKGEVITVGRGHLTAARHFHMAAIIDVITVERRVPEDVLDAFRAQRFAAVILDNVDDLWIPIHPEIDGALFYAVAARYGVARRIDERFPAPVLGWQARPRWILTPRKEPLDERDRLGLARRFLQELNVAQIGHPFDSDNVNDLEVALRELINESQREEPDPSLVP